MAVRKRAGVWRDETAVADLDAELTTKRRGRHDRTRPPAALDREGHTTKRPEVWPPGKADLEALEAVIAELSSGRQNRFWPRRFHEAVRSAHETLCGYAPGRDWQAALAMGLEGYAHAKGLAHLGKGRAPLEPPEDAAKTIWTAVNRHDPPSRLKVHVVAEMCRQVTIGGRGRGRSKTAKRLVEQFETMLAKRQKK